MTNKPEVPPVATGEGMECECGVEIFSLPGGQYWKRGNTGEVCKDNHWHKPKAAKAEGSALPPLDDVDLSKFEYPDGVWASGHKLAMNLACRERQLLAALSKVAELIKELDNVRSVLADNEVYCLAMHEQKEAAEAKVAELERKLDVRDEALIRLRDCDWVITPANRMDAVRDIARDALEAKQ